MNLLKVFTWKEKEVFDRVSEAINESPSIIKPNLYAFWDRKSPIIIQAHIDVVKGSNSGRHYDAKTSKWVDDPPPANKKMELFKIRNVIMCKGGRLGGDDRAGVMAIISINNTCVKDTLPLPSILLTNGEESGGTGMEEFIKDIKVEILAPVNLVLGLDRRGVGEYVYYIEPAQEVKFYIETFGFSKSFGSYSDSKDLSKMFSIPSVNLSVGYYDNHTSNETVHLDEMFLTVKRVIEMIKDPLDQRYGVEKERVYRYYGQRNSNDLDDGQCFPYASRGNKASEKFVQEEKRRRRCETLQKACKLPRICAYFPYFDYLLTDKQIRNGFHIVSTVNGGKSLEEWNYIFTDMIDMIGDKISMMWRFNFGKHHKLYVKAPHQHSFLLAVQVGSSDAFDVPRSAMVCELAEEKIKKEDMERLEAELAKEKQKEEMVAGGCSPEDAEDMITSGSIGTEDFAAVHGYCGKWGKGDCDGGCHGNRHYCDFPEGPDEANVGLLPML